jgi:hypothetical protein
MPEELFSHQNIPEECEYFVRLVHGWVSKFGNGDPKAVRFVFWFDN